MSNGDDADDPAAELLDELERLNERGKAEKVRDELAHASATAGDASLSSALDPLVRQIRDRIGDFDPFSSAARPDLDRLVVKARILGRLREIHAELGGRPGLEAQILSLIHLLVHPIDHEVRDLLAGRHPEVDNADVLELLRDVEGTGADEPDLAESIGAWDRAIREIDE